MTHVIIDPVTRVNGHLRIEAEVSGGIVTDAWSSGQLYRGLEQILVGRDAREVALVAQRTCGRCGVAHGLAAVQAVESALDIRIPENARLLRNLLVGACTAISHATGFYERQLLDWVDPTAALEADPAAAAALTEVGDHEAGTAKDRPAMEAVQGRLAVLTGSGEPEPFTAGPWGSPAYTLSGDVSLVLMAHYLEALEWGRRMAQIPVLLGGKSPHPQTWLVGGMALAAPWGGPRQPDTGQHPWSSNRNAPAPLGRDGLTDLTALLGELRGFVDEVYAPDVRRIASGYASWARLGTGIGHYLSFGAYPQDASETPALLFPRGRVMDRDLTRVVDVGESGVAETTAHAWYADATTELVHPREGVTRPAYDGPPPPISTVAASPLYSWLKAPRYEDDPMETGPAARLLVGYAAGIGEVRTRVDGLTAASGLGPADLGSTLGRVLARSVEAQILAGRLSAWLSELRDRLSSGDLAVADITRWDPGRWPSTAAGWALGESATGALGHWLQTDGRRISTYQIVDGSTWNASPRDDRDRRGAIEQALVGTPVADPDQPVEIVRTVRSFDPCLACASH